MLVIGVKQVLNTIVIDDLVTKTDSSSNFLDIVDDCTQKMKQFLHLLGDIFQPKVCGKVVIGNGFFTDIKLF